MFQDSERSSRIIGGSLLILAGVLYIVSRGISASWVLWLWIVFFGISGLSLGWLYRETQEAWAGIVGYVTGALALLLFVIEVLAPSDLAIPTLVLLLIAAPFVYAWNRGRQQWGLLIPAYVLVAIIPVLFLGDGANADRFVPAYVLGVIGLPFIIAYLVQRQWPFLIPGGIMFALAAFFLLDAIETAAPVLNIVLALGMIGGGAYLLLRKPNASSGAGDDSGLKPKREG
ncbi:MAG: hypothetical protein JXN59_18810 [Anaerolineae bacterium]|nr:hypothetical protein [Anaerolineae bacterium]